MATRPLRARFFFLPLPMCLPRLAAPCDPAGMSHRVPSPASRISPKVRAAVEARVRRGLSIEAAAAEAGLSREGFRKALLCPAVAALVAETQHRLIAEFETLRSTARTRAIEVARQLLETGSEATRLKVLAILLAADKGAAPAVQVNVSQTGGQGGIVVPRPHQRVVAVGEDASGEATIFRIEDATDGPKGARAALARG